MRDLRLEPVPHYNSFNNKTDSELVYPTMHSFPKIQRNEAKLRLFFQAHTHNTMVQRILSFYYINYFIYLFFCTQKAERVLGFSKTIICLLISRGFLLSNLLQLVQLEQQLLQLGLS